MKRCVLLAQIHSICPTKFTNRTCFHTSLWLVLKSNLRVAVICEHRRFMLQLNLVVSFLWDEQSISEIQTAFEATLLLWAIIQTLNIFCGVLMQLTGIMSSILTKINWVCIHHNVFSSKTGNLLFRFWHFCVFSIGLNVIDFTALFLLTISTIKCSTHFLFNYRSNIKMGKKQHQKDKLWVSFLSFELDL